MSAGPNRPCPYLGELSVTIAAKASKAANALSIVGNSLGGMHQTHHRLICLSAIVPMMTFGISTWWQNCSTHIQLLSRVQNIALRIISGTFRTTPAYAMELECSIPPINLTIDFIIQRNTNCFARLDSDNPILPCLPPSKSHIIPAEHNSCPIPFPHPK